jgi:hypothetical protein
MAYSLFLQTFKDFTGKPGEIQGHATQVAGCDYFSTPVAWASSNFAKQNCDQPWMHGP